MKHKNKLGQKKKLKISPFAKDKLGQEEFVGFGLIIIIVAVLLVIFVSFYLKSNNEKDVAESYEVESFIQVMLQYTTDCRDNLDFLSIQKLVFDCIDNSSCDDGRKTCDVLKDTMKKISKESWNIKEGSEVKGYDLLVVYDNETLVNISKGNSTNNYRGAKQTFSRSGQDVEIIFTTSY